MFIFENFTYDNNWASKYYEDFYSASMYFTNYLNKDYKGNGKFMVRRCWDKGHNSFYEISFIDTYNIFSDDQNEVFPLDAHKYAIKMLRNYSGVEITNGFKTDEALGNNQKNIKFIYTIENDEYRWNKEHDNINAGMTYGLILDLQPTLETWLYMLDAYHQRKTPDKRMFSKKKGLKDVCAKYIVAVKMRWDDAKDTLMEVISEILETEQYRDRIPSPFKKWLDAYANFMYEPDEDIQELRNDYKDYSKNISKQAIPSKIMHICKTLDNNPKVKKYENLNGYHYAINVLLTNEQAGRIYIDSYTSRGIKPEEEFYTISVSTNTQHCERRTFPIKLKEIDKEIDSAVNAIYYDDPNELKNNN